jgi:hypothetical protein
VASEQQQTQEQDSEQEDRPLTEKPDVTDEHKEKAQEMRKEYVEDRATVIMPGSGGTVAGTAVNEWLDDDGNPKFGDSSDGDKSGGDKPAGDSSDADGEADGDTVESDKATNEKILKAKAEHDEAGSDDKDDEAGSDDKDDEKDDG